MGRKQGQSKHERGLVSRTQTYIGGVQAVAQGIQECWLLASVKESHHGHEADLPMHHLRVISSESSWQSLPQPASNKKLRSNGKNLMAAGVY